MKNLSIFKVSGGFGVSKPAINLSIFKVWVVFGFQNQKNKTIIPQNQNALLVSGNYGFGFLVTTKPKPSCNQNMCFGYITSV